MRAVVRPWGLILILVLLGCSSSRLPADSETSASSPTALPGVDAYPAELQSRLDEAVKRRGKAYRPRTHHLLEDGSAIYTNRLILETSPYLLQHAHNPVNWYPWGDEAFETARKLGRPVLLSIGYSTCHWCHVMEEESFEDEEIAAYLNANYIAIKVDREERPDVDSIYMSAVQMITGRGGWPMTTWLTPDRKPFHGGTYFPARDGDRGARKGFLTLLRELSDLYAATPDQTKQRAEELAARVKQVMQPLAQPVDALPGHEMVDNAVRGYKAGFDKAYGGMNHAPKFPSSLATRLLLRAHHRTGDAEALRMAELSLTKMAAGGMYDQVGGGFHRYSTDKRWLVPHFEKMLYDNALLTLDYVEAYQATGDENFARVARETVEYVSREMTSPAGGFYSATDADSLTPSGEREEGYFFVWTPQELDRLLGAEQSAPFKAYYNVRPGGNFEGHTILNVSRSLKEVAEQFEMEPDRLAEDLARARGILYEVRGRRPAPLRDEKVLTAWNGLMISAFARAGFVLDEPEWRSRAARAADFLLQNLREDGRLLRSFMDGRAQHKAYLDDYAFLIAGLLDLHEATFELRWLTEALALQKVLDEHYQDAASGGYFMTADDHESLLARELPSYDGAVPSGNSIALSNLLRLNELTTDDRFREAADRMLLGFGERIRLGPRRLAQMLMGLDFRLSSPKEIVLVARRNRQDLEPFLEVLRTTFQPHKVVVAATQGKDLEARAKVVPFLKGKVARKGEATAYVCEGGVCQLPTTDPQTFRQQLTKRSGS